MREESGPSSDDTERIAELEHAWDATEQISNATVGEEIYCPNCGTLLGGWSHGTVKVDGKHIRPNLKMVVDYCPKCDEGSDSSPTDTDRSTGGDL